MAVFNKFQQFSEDLAKGVHNLATDSLMVALCDAAHAPVATNAVLADLTQVAYTNLSSRAVTTTSCEQTAGTTKLILADLVLTASGNVAPFRYAVLYNDTPAGDPLLGWYDYGSEITMVNAATFTVNFDGAAGVLTIA